MVLDKEGCIDMRIIKFYKYDNKNTEYVAVVTMHNSYVRVYSDKEYFFSELTNAFKFLIDDGYTIEHLLK